MPSEADEASVGNAMNKIASFKRGEDGRWPWNELKDLLRAMEIAWNIGRRDMQQDFHALIELLRAGKIHPVVAERLPLSDARRAHELLESSASKGQLVLVP